jgi:hypothetical protein
VNEGCDETGGASGGMRATMVGRMDAGCLLVSGRCGGCSLVRERPVKSSEKVARWAWMKVRLVPGHDDVAEGGSVVRGTSDGGVEEQMSDGTGCCCGLR